jgi:lysophospholipase L1-like esterase
MKKLLFIIVSLFIGIGIALVILESFLRLDQKFGYNYSLCKFKNERLKLLDKDNFRYIRPSALLGYEIIPNSKYGLPVASNSYGLIGREYKLSKDKNTFRILLLGDSIAWQDWSRQSLEKELNSHPLFNVKYKFEIWNAGCPSYDVRRYYLYLKHKGLNYKPDMVIIFLFMNDFELNTNVYYKNQAGATEYYFPISEISKRICVNPFLMKHAYLYRFIILRLDSYLLSKKKIQGARQPEEENGRYYLQMIKEICENKKIPLLAVIFPYLKPLDEYKDYQVSQYKVILKVIKDLKINHLNLYEYLYQENLYSLRGRKEDEIHPNVQTHRFIGKLIYDYLLNSDFMKNRGLK